jgi:hypothetical protein
MTWQLFSAVPQTAIPSLQSLLNLFYTPSANPASVREPRERERDRDRDRERKRETERETELQLMHLLS